MAQTESLGKMHFIKANIRLRAMLMKIKSSLARQEELGKLTPFEEEVKQIVEKYQEGLP